MQEDRAMRVMTALVLAAVAVPAVAQGTADYDFKYSYPAQAGRIAPLKAWLEADKAKLRTSTARDAAGDRRESKRGGFPFRKHDASREWQVVTDTPRFLSLSSVSYGYTGGAHGSTASGSMVWDKSVGKRLDPKTVFVSNAALQAVVMPAWCKWMRAERDRRAGGPMPSDGIFGKCPAVKDVTVLLGSSNGRAFDRIGVIADQYVVGSYAEGQYETTVPVSTAVLRAVKPEYRGAFAVR
ncbi:MULTISPECIES: DUF4163 domain-containing protein [unclassified Sphingomonas]|uniref:DUF4163 domain-containing protein n=1 Tax=unclassified Sphingomonas TaxID=196159 RepID=UPI001F1C276B|nr:MULTISPECIES: DUF4163 domain-containing protein [unclassified Sphingomonas]